MDSMRDRFTAVATELLDTDERIAVVLADIGVAGFHNAGAIGRHPSRVINVGIREQAMIGIGAGLALEGFRPIIHTYAPFLVERPYEQVKLDLLHQGVGAILVSVGASHDAATSGRTHHSPADVHLISALADWEIAVPGHPDELESILRQSASQDHNVYIRLAGTQNTEPVSSRGLAVIREGLSQPPTVLTVGPMLDPTLEATADMDVRIVYTPHAKPWNRQELRAAVGDGDVIVVEPYLEGTSLRSVAAALADAPRRFLAIGVGEAENRGYGTPRDHDVAHGLDPAGIKAAIEGFVAG